MSWNPRRMIKGATVASAAIGEPRTTHYRCIRRQRTLHGSATLWQSTLTLPNVGNVSNVPRQRIVDLDGEVNASVGQQRRGLTATAHEGHFALHRISVYSTLAVIKE